MSGPATAPPQVLQEVVLVLCIDASIQTAMFWRTIFRECVTQLLQCLSKMYTAICPTKLRVGAVVYSRPSLDPPIITNTYFMDLQAGFKDWQDNQVAFGLGSCPGPEDGGMALLEALVASLEMCDHIIKETATPVIPHPKVPKVPPRKPPVCHILLVTSFPASGPSRPLHNHNPRFDGLTLETIPAELSKRGIKLNCITPRAIPMIREIFDKVGDVREEPWFQTHPDAVWLLSGYGKSGNQGPGKRPHTATLTDNGDQNKRAKVETSPTISMKVSNQGSPAVTGAVTKPVGVPDKESPSKSESVPKPPSSTTEYTKSQREHLMKHLNAMGANPSAGPATTTPTATPMAPGGGATQQAGGDSASNSANVSKEPPAPVAAGTPTHPAASSPSQPMVKTASGNSNPSADAPISRPQSQPQNPSASSVPVPRGAHNRSQSSATSSHTPASAIHQSPNIQASPSIQHARTASQTGSTSVPSPAPNAIQASPKRPASVASGANAPAAIPNLSMQNNPAIAKALAARAGLGLPGNPGTGMPTPESMAQQQAAALQAKLSAQGLLGNSSSNNQANQAGPSNPAPAPPNEHHPNADLWQGTLTMSIVDPQGSPREVTAAVIAKPASSKQSKQFALWPPRLHFNLTGLRAYQIQEFSQIVKSNSIPLCIFEANPSLAANIDGDVKRRNDICFTIISNFLSSKGAGAAIYFPLPTQVPNTGIFIFATRSGGQTPAALLGAAFFTQPIPALPTMADAMQAAATAQNMQNPALRQLGMQQHPAGAEANINPPMFDANARNGLLMQQRMAAQQGRMPWPQGMPGNQNAQAQASQLARMGAPGGLGGMPGGQMIPPQAQAQSRVLAAGLGGLGSNAGLGPAGVPTGFDQANAMSAALQSGQMGGGGMNFAGGMANMFGAGGMQGMPNMSQLTPEMMRILQSMNAANGGMGGQPGNPQ